MAGVPGCFEEVGVESPRQSTPPRRSGYHDAIDVGETIEALGKPEIVRAFIVNALLETDEKAASLFRHARVKRDAQQELQSWKGDFAHFRAMFIVERQHRIQVGLCR